MSKWNDASVKDLTFAVLMSTNNGSINVKANWDKVEQTMKSWGYDFSKSAMSQQWGKKITKEFRLRHGGDGDDGGSVPSTPARTKSVNPKTPISSKTKNKGMKRKAEEDYSDDSEDFPAGSFTADSTPKSIAKDKPRRAAAKKIKYEAETKDEDNDGHDGVNFYPKVKMEDDNFSLEM